MTLRFFPLVAVLVATAVVAQTPFIYHPDDNTAPNYSAPAGWYPWFTNVTGSRVQTIVPASALSNVTGGLTSLGAFLGIASSSGTSVTFSQVSITLATATAPTMTTTFANNFVPGTAVQVLNATNVVIASPVNGWYDFQFTVPYAYSAGDLLVDVVCQISGVSYFSSSVSTLVPRLVAATYTGQATGAYSTGSGNKYRFGYDPSNRLFATSLGSGSGDLTLSVQNLSPLATEGFLLISTDATHPLGTGPLLGLYPDALTWQILTEPLTLGSPFHFPCNVGLGLFPDAPLVAPPGSLSFLAGQSWDFGFVVFGPGFTYIGRSPANRVVW